MDTHSQSESVEMLGCKLVPAFRHASPGCSSLIVAIRHHPAGKHFDPQELHVRVKDHHNSAKRRTFSWQSATPESTHLCPGPVTLIDRFDKRVEFFAFGGSLYTTQGEGELQYEIESPAPIIPLSDVEDTVPNQLAAESESLVVEAKAAWGIEEGFDRRIAALDSLEFYLAVVHSLLLVYHQSPPLAHAYRDLMSLLLKEMEWAASTGLWADEPKTVEQILAPGRGAS